jgi:HCOMODA/2-hydroxy-3-carboxy-muconic semialdehyde decarboxylase
LSAVDDCLRDLIVANRILANEQVLDAYGHVSVRHPERPDRFFLSCSRAPELVVRDDLMEYDLDCNPIDQQGRMMVAERPIHGAVYATRPDVMAVVHNHAHELIPFSVTEVKLRPLFHMAASLGPEVPVWDIRWCAAWIRASTSPAASGPAASLSCAAMAASSPPPRCAKRW